MATKLYVGGLPYHKTQEELRGLFERIGSVQSVSIITDRMTGKSRGFGFVEMGSEEEAQAAISQLNGQQMEGRSITVNEARPQAPRNGGGGGFNRGFGGGNSRGGGRPRPRW